MARRRRRDATSIKQQVWNTLGSNTPEIRHTGAQAVAKIAGAEIPAKQWPDLVTGLQSNVANTGAPAGLRQATLEALGYICEEIDSDHLSEGEVNAMLTAIFSGMRKEEPDVEVRLAATVALSNAMYFAEQNFERQHERDHIMQVTCECTVCPDVRVRQAAYEVLVGVAENYYDKLAPYITAIFNLTTKATKEDEEAVALQAIEFWSAVCEEEVAIQEELEEGGSNPPVYHKFVEQALGQLVPMLLETLTKQDEDQVEDGDDAWNVAMAGGTCLGLVATCVRDPVVDAVMPFITANISNQTEWRAREAATFAFGSILEGPDGDKLAPVASQALPFLLAATKDANSHVRDTTAWTIGSVFEFVGAASPPVVTPANLNEILTALVAALQDKPFVAGKACWALQRLAVSCCGEDDSHPMRAALAPVLPGHRAGAARGVRARRRRVWAAHGGVREPERDHPRVHRGGGGGGATPHPGGDAEARRDSRRDRAAGRVRGTEGEARRDSRVCCAARCRRSCRRCLRQARRRKTRSSRSTPTRSWRCSSAFSAFARAPCTRRRCCAWAPSRTPAASTSRSTWTRCSRSSTSG
jgi:importin subunit beta-1